MFSGTMLFWGTYIYLYSPNNNKILVNHWPNIYFTFSDVMQNWTNMAMLLPFYVSEWKVSVFVVETIIHTSSPVLQISMSMFKDIYDKRHCKQNKQNKMNQFLPNLIIKFDSYVELLQYQFRTCMSFLWFVYAGSRVKMV